MTARQCDIDRFYDLLARLEERVGGKRTLNEFATGIAPRVNGVYFFFEPDEYRSHGSRKLRVVRVGTHRGRTNSGSSVWTRLFEHKMDYGRSVFRDQVRVALRNRAAAHGCGCSKSHYHERCVSEYIGKMPFLWMKVEATEKRRRIERNVVAMLSNYQKTVVDDSSNGWPGKFHDNEKIAKSGLWNIHYVTRAYTPFLSELERLIDKTEKLDVSTRSEILCLDR